MALVAYDSEVEGEEGDDGGKHEVKGEKVVESPPKTLLDLFMLVS